MHQTAKCRAALLATALISLSAIAGCDDGASQVAREAANRQAEQNRTMAALQQEVAAGARQLVEEEGAARASALKLHQDLQSERATLSVGWNDLETQRRQVARERRLDSFWTAVLPASGSVAVGAMALAFAWLALFGLRRSDDSNEVACQVLVEQFMTADDAALACSTALLDLAHEHPVAGLLTEPEPDPPTESP